MAAGYGMDAITPREGWTPERRRLCIELWEADKHSAHEIAALIGGGLNRNAVIGFAFRQRKRGILKSKRGQNNYHYQPAPPTIYKQLGIPKSTFNGRVKRGQIPTEGPTYTPRKKAVPVPVHVSVTDPTPGEWVEFNMPRHSFEEIIPTSCRWPIGEEPPYQFCGLRQIDGASFCAHHSRMAYVRGPSPRLSTPERMRRSRQAAALFRRAL